MPHFSKELAQGCWKLKNNQSYSLGLFLPVILHFATKLFTVVPNILGHWMCVPAAYKQTKRPKSMQPLTLRLGHVIERYIEIERLAHMVKISHFLTFLPVSKLKNWQWPSSSPCISGHGEVHQEKEPHFSKELAQGCWKLKITYLQVWRFLPVNLHFAAKLFAAVPNFLGHWMLVLAAYKQTKNQINATTHITAGSCYREVHWNRKVCTSDGQNFTFSHLSVCSKLRNLQWPSSSRCIWT